MVVHVATQNQTVVAVDIGGTFTDAVLSTSSGLFTAKVLTTPADPAQGFMECVRRVLAAGNVHPGSVERVVHGTTLATNVILERRGAAIALITTDGYRSLLALGRHGRVEEERYDLWGSQPEPIVPLSHTFEVRGRMQANGDVLVAFDAIQAAEVADAIAALGVAGVAICFLNSYVDDRHELAMAEICRSRLGPRVSIVTSASVLPEMREFERLTTTVMSAYVGPVMSDYLRSLAESLAQTGVHAPIFVMESAGGVMPAALAASFPVHTIESGPAAGVIAAARFGGDCGADQIVAFDMGGTTAKAALVRGGRPDITHDFIVGGKGSFGGRRAGSGTPVKIPAIDLAEVGSGGGSIAWLDPAGAVRVGPRSAGASPGPACYGAGGVAPTVTDANLILGYMSSDSMAGGTMRLDVQAAIDAVTLTVARPLRVSLHDAAYAIHDIANADMAAAIHVVTVQRGIDPRRFTLVATGGAAAIHACRIAARFEMREVIVPPHAGVGSAVGLVRTDLLTERSRSALVPLADADPRHLQKLFDDLTAAAAEDLESDPRTMIVERTVAMRFVGQAHELEVAVSSGSFDARALQALEQTFLSDYRRVFGLDVRGAIELVSFRSQVRRSVGAPIRDDAPEGVDSPVALERAAWFPERGGLTPTKVARRGDLEIGRVVDGPFIIEAADSTTVVPPGWTATVHPSRSLLLRPADRHT